MRRINRILLAIHQAQPGRVELRASLLGPQLDIGSFDVIAVKRACTGMRGATTTFSHVQVDGNRLSALVDGQPRLLGAGVFPDELENVWTVQRGNPADVIAGTAERIGADLTLLAGAGRPALPQWVRPARNADVIRLCRSPVLLVHTEPRDVYRSVVVATDFSRASLSAARTAALLAPAARFVFVHACPLPGELMMMRELELPVRAIRGCQDHSAAAVRRRLDEFVDLFLQDLPAGEREVHVGRPCHVIEECAQRHDADLVVLGRGATHPGARLSVSKLMPKLLDEGRRDLLVGPDHFGDDTDRRLAA
ncbi:universal stress protein [Massilia consociata]|uniref:Universal stress protein n=1 Tax=Massilia consociata TaxID=760117 RepID=A0ABV6FBK6_9BURK